MDTKEIDNSFIFLKNKRIWFSDSVYDIKGYSSIFFRECKFKKDIPNFQRIDVPVITIDLTQSLDDIWKKMNRNTRRNIKKAEENKIVIKLNENYDEFYNMYLEHIKMKKHIKWFDLEKIETIKQSNIFTAEYEGKIISGLAFLENQDDLICWIACSKRFTPELKSLVGNASHLIHWEAIKYAKAKNIKEYSLSGTPINEKGEGNSLAIYKIGFGGEIKTYYTYYKDYNIFMKLTRGTYKRFIKRTTREDNESTETDTDQK